MIVGLLTFILLCSSILFFAGSAIRWADKANTQHHIVKETDPYARLFNIYY